MGLDEPPDAAEDDLVDEFVDERPWQALVKLKSGDIESGVELGGERAVHCLRWMNGKVLEHSGFQGECFYLGYQRAMNLCALKRRFCFSPGCVDQCNVRVSFERWSDA